MTEHEQPDPTTYAAERGVPVLRDLLALNGLELAGDPWRSDDPSAAELMRDLAAAARSAGRPASAVLAVLAVPVGEDGAAFVFAIARRPSGASATQVDLRPS